MQISVRFANPLCAGSIPASASYLKSIFKRNINTFRPVSQFGIARNFLEFFGISEISAPGSHPQKGLRWERKK